MIDAKGLGRAEVKAGQILNLNYLDGTTSKTVTVVAIEDIDLSHEMVEYVKTISKEGNALFTENAIPGLLEILSKKGLIHVDSAVNIYIGKVGRPASRLLNEQRFEINPENFWDVKLIERYDKKSFQVLNRQGHSLTVIRGVEAPFYMTAEAMSLDGEYLGNITLSILSDSRHTTLAEDDIERLRLALQSDIAIGIPEISIVINKVTVSGNSSFGQNKFAALL